MRRVMLLVLLASALPMAALADSISGPFYGGTAVISGPGFSYSSAVTPAQLGGCTIVGSDIPGFCSQLRQGTFCCYTVRDYNTESIADTSTGIVTFTEEFPDHAFAFLSATLGATTITQHGDTVELFGTIVGDNVGFGPPFGTVPAGSFVRMDLTLVPEPSTLVLLGTGVIVFLAGMARRRFNLGRHVPVGNYY